MVFLNGFVFWESEEDKAAVMDFCKPHTDPPQEEHQFVQWLCRVIDSHLEDGGERLLYATFISAFLMQLPAATANLEGRRYLAISERAMRNASSSPHERSSTREIGNASFLH